VSTTDYLRSGLQAGPSHEPPLEPADEGIDLLQVAAAYISQWRLFAVSFVVVAAVSILYVFSLKSQYVATATFLPQASTSQSDPYSALFSPRSPGEVFVGLLRSRSVQDDVVDRAHVLSLLKTNSYETARGAVAGKASFSVGGDGIVQISIRDRDAQQAAVLANDYLDALQHLNDSMAQQQNREMQSFFQSQLEQEKIDLDKAEANLEATQKKTGLIQPDTQTQIGLNAIAGVRSQITNLQVQLASLLQSETDANPEVKRLRSQIAQLQAQERTLESGSGSSPVGAAPPAGELPQNNLDFTRAQREVQYHNQLVNSLSAQFGSAHLDEHLSRPAFQVIDRAVVPEHKSWPPRRDFVIVAIFFALVAALLLVTLRLVALRVLSDPKNRASLAQLRQALHHR
jgi:uncharacterized protein involved in exopolysaccharide biosynthesis